MFISDYLPNEKLTTIPELVEQFQLAAHSLLNAYVRIQGVNLSERIRRNTESRDWLNVMEPRSVRPVMRLISQDIEQMNNQVICI